MDRHWNFIKNLEAIQRINGQSLAEFAQEIGIPKSTLQSVLEQGNTTLYTAIRISDGLDLPLDALVNDELLAPKVDIARYLLQNLDWFHSLTVEDQETVILHLGKILEVIRK